MPSFYRPRIGISSCLLGDTVRWDGGHKRDPWLVDVFGVHVDWVPVCPEVEAGFGTPREPMQLVRAADRNVRLVTTTGRDLTAQLEQFAAARVERLAHENLSGYVLKSNSPSCGVERVRVYGQPDGEPTRDGRGLFAEALIARFPELPVEEEGHLADPAVREQFLERVLAYQRRTE